MELTGPAPIGTPWWRLSSTSPVGCRSLCVWWPLGLLMSAPIAARYGRGKDAWDGSNRRSLAACAAVGRVFGDGSTAGLRRRFGFLGSLVQSNSAGQRTRLTNVARQADLIRYYDADVSGWQVAVGLDAHTAHGSHITAQDPNRVAEMVDKAALDRMLPRFPVRYLTSSERRTYLAIVHDWGAFWSLDAQAFALYVKGDQASLARADKIVNGPSNTDAQSLSRAYWPIRVNKAAAAACRAPRPGHANSTPPSIMTDWPVI